MTAIIALWKREILKFTADRSRLIGAFLQPVIFWLLMGLGFRDSFSSPQGAGNSYMEFLFPGMVVLIIMFTAIFSTISIVEDKSSGFLQGALVSPASRFELMIGNISGGTTMALAEALLFMLFYPFLNMASDMEGLLTAFFVCLLTAITFTSLGFSLAWRSASTRGFHAIMNIILLPIWIMSGAVFPLEGAAPVMQWIILINPVTYVVSALRQSLAPAIVVAGPLGSLPLAMLVICVFSVLALYYGWYTIARATRSRW